MNIASYYATIPLPHTAPLDEVLNALIKDDMTADWPILYREYYEQLYPPIPCLNQNLREWRYVPEAGDAYDIPTSLAECRDLSTELWWAADSVNYRFSKWKFVLEEHFGANVTNEPYQIYPLCFRDCLHVHHYEQPLALNEFARAGSLHPVLHEAARARSLQESEKHLSKCEFAAHDVMLQVNNALKMLPQLQARYQDIKLWSKEVIERNQGNIVPQLLRTLMLEVNKWLRVIVSACRGFLNDWEKAESRHKCAYGVLRGKDLPFEDLADIWNARLKKNAEYQANKFPSDALIPLPDEEIWAISMRQRMNAPWPETTSSENMGLSNPSTNL